MHQKGSICGKWLHINFSGILETESIADWTFKELETKAQFDNSSDFVIFNQVEVRVGVSIKSSCGISVNRTFQGADVIRGESIALSLL